MNADAHACSYTKEGNMARPSELRERAKETVLLGLEGKPINGFSW